MLVLAWFVVCIIFAFVQFVLGDSGHALELFAIISAIAFFLISKTFKTNRIERIYGKRWYTQSLHGS